jgi:hypothetical protein
LIWAAVTLKAADAIAAVTRVATGRLVSGKRPMTNHDMLCDVCI